MILPLNSGALSSDRLLLSTSHTSATEPRKSIHRRHGHLQLHQESRQVKPDAAQARTTVARGVSWITAREERLISWPMRLMCACTPDVRTDRERTRGAQQPGGQQQYQQQQQQQQQQAGGAGAGGYPSSQPAAAGGPSRGTTIPQQSQGIPTGSYRDANGIPRSIAQDQPIAASYR